MEGAGTGVLVMCSWGREKNVSLLMGRGGWVDGRRADLAGGEGLEGEVWWLGAVGMIGGHGVDWRGCKWTSN